MKMDVGILRLSAVGSLSHAVGRFQFAFSEKIAAAGIAIPCAKIPRASVSAIPSAAQNVRHQRRGAGPGARSNHLGTPHRSSASAASEPDASACARAGYGRWPERERAPEKALHRRR